MRSFEKEVIFVKHFLKLDLYFDHIYRCLEHIDSIYKIEPLLHFTNKTCKNLNEFSITVTARLNCIYHILSIENHLKYRKSFLIYYLIIHIIILNIR